ncbi:integrase arm-type DNA-binding domain-containing protein [[Pasteurella] aerogenes]|nr:integrase arm-type DNA-binding domain-containing protein [[Pasteurella] aerogenes]
MAKVKPLNDTQIKNAKSTGKVGGDWLADGDGLYLVITPIGSKIWKFRYFTPIQKARTTYTIGNYPDTQTANAAIKRMGYHGKLVAHGLRSIASTYLNEQGYDKDLIEVALSHINQDRVRMAYNRADYIKQRFVILQAWADFIDECSQGAVPQYHLKVVNG